MNPTANNSKISNPALTLDDPKKIDSNVSKIEELFDLAVIMAGIRKDNAYALQCMIEQGDTKTGRRINQIISW